MVDVIDDLKQHARVLQRRAKSGEGSALDRLRKLPELAGADDAAIAAAVKRRHCLAAVAHELGFAGWSHAVHVLGGTEGDFGTLLHSGSPAHWNIWSASYEEARTIRSEHGGYLLAYKRHYFIVDRFYIEAIGLDPDDPDWDRIGRDWVRPADPSARARLYAALVRRRLAMA